MVDSLVWRLKGEQFQDDDGELLAAGYLEYRHADTDMPLVTYKDPTLSTPHTESIDLDSSGRLSDPVYIGTTAFKELLFRADDTQVFSSNGYPGAKETPPALTTAPPSMAMATISQATVLEAGDVGKIHNIDPTGGGFSVMLPDALEAGTSWIGFRHAGLDSQATIVAQSGQTIRSQKFANALPLMSMGEMVFLVASGPHWYVIGYVPPFLKASLPIFDIAGRSSSPPLTTAPGERWIAQGVLSGAWATLGFQDKDVAESDGNGSWVRYVPAEGWIAYDVTLQQLLQFKSGAWVTIPTVVDPGSSVLKTLLVQDQKSSGTNGGAPVTSTWTTAVLNTVVSNSIDSAALNTNRVTLLPGTYRIRASKAFHFTKVSRLRWKTADSNDIIIHGVQVVAGIDLGSNDDSAACGAIATIDAVFTVPGSSPVDFVLQYWASNAYSEGGDRTSTLGLPASIGGTVEVYASVLIEDLRSIQGATGGQGPAGSVSFSNGGELTIASGVITVTGTYHRVDTQSDASTDDLDTINGGGEGRMLILRAENAARTVVVKDGTGNLALEGDCTLDNSEDTITLIYDGGLDKWLETARSNNGA